MRPTITHHPFAAEELDPLCETTPELVPRLATAPFRRFAVMGDSLSAGTGDHAPGYEPSGWADRVSVALQGAHPEAEYLNTAVVGATSAEALAHQATAIREFTPDLLHVPSGANDITTERPDFARIEDELRQLFSIGTEADAVLTVFTFGTYDVPQIHGFPDRVRELNAIVRRVAADHAAIVVDMEDHPVNQRTDLVSADRIHFTTMGQAVMATEYVRAVTPTTPEAEGRP